MMLKEQFWKYPKLRQVGVSKNDPILTLNILGADRIKYKR